MTDTQPASTPDTAPDPTAQNPPADWSWQDDPDVVSWDHRQDPDLDELRQLLARHGVTLTEVDTGTDDVAVRIAGPERNGEPPADAAPTAAPDTSGGSGDALREGIAYLVYRAVDIGDPTRAAALETADAILEAARKAGMLVDPAAARVLAAARWCRDADNDGLHDDFDAAARELHAAVDAAEASGRLSYTNIDIWGPESDEPAPEPCRSPMHKACRCVRPAGHDGACNCAYPDGVPTEPAPEPAGDGPGWQRERLQMFIDGKIHGGPEEERQVAALLADRDRLAHTLDAYAVARQREQDAARAELAGWREAAEQAQHAAQEAQATAATLAPELAEVERLRTTEGGT